LLLLPLLITGCRSLDARRYPTAKEWNDAHGGTNAAWHSVRMVTSPDPPSFHWYQKANPIWWLKNNEDPVPPEDYLPGKRARKLKWNTRNSCHNFDFYVIGVSDRETVRSGKYPESIGNPHGGWNIAVTKYKRLRLLFVSYKSQHVEFYLGWRERGNFGAKFNIRKSKPGQDSPTLADNRPPQ
jgi:hypothetical protein